MAQPPIPPVGSAVGCSATAAPAGTPPRPAWPAATGGLLSACSATAVSAGTVAREPTVATAAKVKFGSVTVVTVAPAGTAPLARPAETVVTAEPAATTSPSAATAVSVATVVAARTAATAATAATL